MDWLAFVASLIASLAWPVVALAIVVLLRRELNRLLPGLNRVKNKDFELEFGKQVAQARAEIEASAPPPQLPAGDSRTGRNELYFQTLAEVSPRAALLEAWIPFEIAAARIAEATGVSQPGQPVQMPRLIEGLTRESMLTDEEARGVARLRGIRGDVAQSPDVNLSRATVAEYASLLLDVTDAMERRAKARKWGSGATSG